MERTKKKEALVLGDSRDGPKGRGSWRMPDALHGSIVVHKDDETLWIRLEEGKTCLEQDLLEEGLLLQKVERWFS